MSHFTVLVHIPYSEAQNNDMEELVEEKLLPYHEYECTGIKKYIEKIDITDEYMESYLKDTIPVLFDKKTNKQLTTKYGNDSDQYKTFDGELLSYVEVRDIHANHYYSSFEEYLRNWHGFNFDNKFSAFEDGRLYKFTNPNAKWDWYTIGGRWSGMFLDFNGKPHDIIKKGDWDLEQIKKNVIEKYLPYYEQYKASGIDDLEFIEWSKIVESFDDIDEARKVYHNQEYVKRLKELFSEYHFQQPETFYKKSQEEFINKQYLGETQTFAVVDEHGWHERGEMGWFAMVSNENLDWDKIYLDKLNEIDDNDYLVLVDCHI